MEGFGLRQAKDTVFVSFTPDYSIDRNRPRDDADMQFPVEMVLGLPTDQQQSIRVINGRVSVEKLSAKQLTLELVKTRLQTDQLRVTDYFTLTSAQNSFATLGSKDQYKALQVVVKDSSGVLLNDVQTVAFSKQVSPRAEIQLRGRALSWLK